MKHLLSLLLLCLLSLSLFSQNAEQAKNAIDSYDIEEVFNTLGIRVFKYPIKLPEGNYNVSLEMYYYRNSKLIDKKSLIDSATLALFPTFFQVTEEDSVIRLYVSNNTGQEYLKIKIGIDGITDTIRFVKDYLPYSDWKVMTWNQIEIGKEIPILMKYTPIVQEFQGQTIVRNCLPGTKEEEFANFFTNYCLLKLKFVKQ